MENKVDTSQTSSPVKEMRKCKCCGKVLPIDEFTVSGRGYRKICKHCEHKEYFTSDKFKEFSSRDLILELRARGYIGKLQYRKVVIEDVVI